MTPTTACQCGQPGWCERHQCRKSEMLWDLCRRNPVLFAAWEQGQGPGQAPLASEAASKGPGLLRRGVNVAKAGVRHLANGLRRVDQAAFDQRLATCLECPQCDPQRLVCLHTQCGCFLQEKAWWASEDCPLGRWPALNGPAESAGREAAR